MQLTLKINNQLSTSQIRIIDGRPTLNWSFTELVAVNVSEYTGIIQNSNDIPQSTYEIRISFGSNTNIGNDAFYGNIIQTGVVSSTDKFWRYDGPNLERGGVYHGQIRVEDNVERNTGWVSFSFRFNTLPIITNIYLDPSVPSVNTDIDLHYTMYDADGDTESGTKVRWFKNGVHQPELDNLTAAASRFLQNGETWLADVFPSDGYEYGSRYSTNSVLVSTSAPVVTEANISPTNPTENDILRVNTGHTGNLNISKSSIRWFVNGILERDFNDQEYARLDVSAGDTVNYEIKPNESTSFVASETVTILAAKFAVYNLRIDGNINPLDVSTLRPILTWNIHKPIGQDVRYISINVGSYYGASDIHSEVQQTDILSYTIPGNLLHRGSDYYVSVSVSATTTFDGYTMSHFRLTGSRWQEAVSNTTGWTIEAILVIDSASQEDFDETKYQVIRIQDGNMFAEVRLHNQKMSLMSTLITYSDIIDTTGNNAIIICGINQDIKVYHNGVLVINGTGLMSQSSTSKLLEIGVGTQTALIASYKEINYTVDGYYDPIISGEFSNIQFYSFVEVPGFGVDAITSYAAGGTEMKVFGLNPDNLNDSGAIYSIQQGESLEATTVSRTFSPINRIHNSANGKYSVFAHSRGSAIFSSYFLSDNDFIHNTDFVTSQSVPTVNGWELVQNIGQNAAYLETDGLHINTLFERTGATE